MNANTARAISLAKQLIRYPSVSSVSNEAISQFVADELTKLGFSLEWLTYQDANHQTKVSVVGKRGDGVGGVAYLCHTDVVPAEDWSLDFCGAFEPIEKGDKLFGRGACDMKGSLATALTAAGLISEQQNSPLYFVVTSDEEVGMQGARLVREKSKYFAEMVDSQTIGIVGEPTLLEVVHAHKGGLRFHVTARGISAHTSTTDGKNANYQLIPALAELMALREESETEIAYRNEMFNPPTLSWNMTLTNEPEAVNVTTSLARLNNFMRTMDRVDHKPLIERVRTICDTHGLEFTSNESIDPWSVKEDSAWVTKMLQIVDKKKSRSVCYATDAAVLQALPTMLICGPGDIQQAHRSDEWISFEQLQQGINVYERAFFELGKNEPLGRE